MVDEQPQPIPPQLADMRVLQSMNNEVSEQLVKLLIDQKELLAFIEKDLSGEALDLETGTWKKVSEEKMNAEGRREIINLIMIHIGGNTTLSTMSEEQIDIMCENLHDKLAIMFGIYYKKYGIKKEDRQMILTKIMNVIFLALKRSTESMTLKGITKTTREAYFQGDQKKKGGIRSLFGG